ncbi:hypothetical protein [Phycicoccus sp.]|uniref:hypothetical protein n=1 Tax=Phycicoccus sp. TaxID=1902410 RepID=UPI00345E4F3E
MSIRQRIGLGEVLPSAARRFWRIDGIDQSGLLAMELFTTVLPLTILGFSAAKGFAADVSVGEIFIRQLRLDGQAAEQVRSAFGSMSGTQTWWTVMGLAGFLIWGVPMALTVSKMYAAAWQRPELPTMTRLWRGALWFALYLPTMFVSERLGMAGRASEIGEWLPFTISLLPPLLFWSLTPVLLLPGVPHRRGDLLRYGLVGVLVNAVILRLAGRLVFPQLLAGWEGFGPIGVAMTLLTWSLVLGVGWVLTACLTGVMVDSTAPLEADEEPVTPLMRQP